MNPRLLNLVAFQAGWFACVLGAAYGLPLAGPAVVAFLAGFHLLRSPAVGRELLFLLTAGILGAAVDTAHLWIGLFAVQGQVGPTMLAPPWLIALWVIFSTTLNSSLSWLTGRYALAVVLGVLAGPLAYLAGARLGAIALPVPAWHSLLFLGIDWGLALPVLVWLARVLPTPAEVPAKAGEAT